MSEYGREAPTWSQPAERLAQLWPSRAERILASVTPAPRRPAPPTGEIPPMPGYATWTDFLQRSVPGERGHWCVTKARKANRERLMSGRPETRITAEDVWTILEAARGRCARRDCCGSFDGASLAMRRDVASLAEASAIEGSTRVYRESWGRRGIRNSRLSR